MMKRPVRKGVEIEMLIARIESARRSYSISETQLSGASRCTDDEAILEIVGRIEQATHRYREHVGEVIEISLICTQRYREEGLSEGDPRLVSLTLRRGERTAMAYLPSAPFWSLPSMLESEANYVQAHFERVRYGSGKLLSLTFGSIDAMCNGDQSSPPSRVCRRGRSRGRPGPRRGSLAPTCRTSGRSSRGTGLSDGEPRGR